MLSVSFECTPANDIPSILEVILHNGFVSPQEVVKSLIITMLMFSFHFSKENCSYVSYAWPIDANCPYLEGIDVFVATKVYYPNFLWLASHFNEEFDANFIKY